MTLIGPGDRAGMQQSSESSPSYRADRSKSVRSSQVKARDGQDSEEELFKEGSLLRPKTKDMGGIGRLPGTVQLQAVILCGT